ncbi:MAG: trimethylamine methyltransferase [Rhodobacteraceae bacterium]|nr:trimethylamine methyltransferase [Paracoccaceae bacterium]
MIAQFATLLTQEQVEQVHQASLEILENVGLLVRNEKARKRLAQHGCQVDSKVDIVKFPRQVVEHFRAAYPPTFTFHGRDPQYDRTIPDDGPLIMTGSSAPNIIDPITGHERRARSDDMARIAHLFNELPALDIFSVSVLCDDAPAGHYSLSRYYPALKNTLKPVRGNVSDVDEAKKVIKLGYLVAGSEAAYRERPLITHHYCAVVSPLTLDFDSTELLMFLTEEGFPGYASIVPNAGLTSPLTLMGPLAQGNAEFLAWATLKQMTRSGATLVYSALPTVADMRTGAYAPGGIENGILAMGFAQLARYYNVPSASYVGLTNAKVVDAQAGFEKSLSPMASMLAGSDLLNMAGLIDAIMTFDFTMLTIDNEIAEMMKRVKRGLEFSQENMALDLITEAGPAGMFIDTPHTLERMKSCAVLPEIADRNPRRIWAESGKLDAQAKAMQRVRDILTRDNPAVFSPDVDARIRAEFEGLVSGNSTPPPGWTPPEPTRTRDRKNRRIRR